MTPGFGSYGRIEYLTKGGTANGVTTDGLGYVVGATTITIAPGGTGRIDNNQIIRFVGDDHNYRVQTGLADVSLGGNIVLTTPLRQAIGTVPTPVWTGGEARMQNAPAATGYLAGNVPSNTIDWYEQGDVGQVVLNYGYGKLDHIHTDYIQQSLSLSQVKQTQEFGELERYTFTQDYVTDASEQATLSDVAAMDSFLDTAIGGTEFIWFPDYTAYPHEFFTCVLDKYDPPQRYSNLGRYTVTFTIRILPPVEIPATIPAFV